MTSLFSSFFMVLYSIPSHNIKCGKIFQALLHESKTIRNLLAFGIHDFTKANINDCERALVFVCPLWTPPVLTLADSRVPIVFIILISLFIFIYFFLYLFLYCIFFFLGGGGVLLFCMCAWFFLGGGRRGGGECGYACGWLYHTKIEYILSYVFQAIYTNFEQQWHRQDVKV